MLQLVVQPLLFFNYREMFPSLRVEPGMPKGVAVEESEGVFMREFSDARVRFDCNNFNATFIPT